jgi:hypothetical protein
MSMVSSFSPLTSAGIFSATLFSAHSCFVSAPQTFQVSWYLSKRLGEKEENVRRQGHLKSVIFSGREAKEGSVLCIQELDCNLGS